MVRKLFGTDGVRGVAGEDLTAELARDLGAAAVAWAGPGAEVVIGRDTRESGEWLEAALVEGVVAAGGQAVRAGVIPTPGVAVLTHSEGAELGCVISASHNPYRDNGIKFLGRDGRKLADAAEAQIEAGIGTAAPAQGGAERSMPEAGDAYLEWLASAFGAAIPDWPLVLDCANGAAYDVGPRMFSRVGTVVEAIGVQPDGRNINAGVGSTHLDAVAEAVRSAGAACGLAFDGDADRCLAVDAGGRPVNGDAIIAAVALARGLDRVVVTSMTNLGFHRVMREHGIAVEVTDVGDRYVLERMLATGAELGGEQSGHVVDLRHHTTGDGIATGLMLLSSLDRLGMSMAELADLVVPFPQRLVAVPADRAALPGAGAVWQEVERLSAELGEDGLATGLMLLSSLDRLGMSMAELADLVVPFPQRLVAVPADRAALPGAGAVWQEVERLSAELGEDGRIVLRPSGTEPVVRVMVEAADPAVCDAVCERLVGVVSRELGV